MHPGTRNLITDVAGFRVGNASDARIRSGATVFLGDVPFTAAVHVMGGAPGTRETDLLAPDKLVQQVDALVLSGGSSFGLDAASGVADRLRAAGRGFIAGSERVPIVPAAILFDLLNGGDKSWEASPYRELGCAALDAADDLFPLGSHGAGTGATTCRLKGGLGSASLVLDSGVTVGALVAVNAIGDVVGGPNGEFWAGLWEIGEEYGGLGPVTRIDPTVEPGLKQGQSTTIAIVATDAALSKAECQRMATAAHDGMARAIVPSHTPFDGDLVFGVSSGVRPLKDSLLETLRIGHAAATCLTRAIARGVHAAEPAPDDRVPCWQARYGGAARHD